MEVDFQKKYIELEESHWWFKARRDMIFGLINKMPHNAVILDVGSSGGALLEFLKNKGFLNLSGVDISLGAIERCRQRGLGNVFVADALRLPFSADTFDVVIASDILEHMENDRSALSEWKRVLKSGGILIVFVPAFNFLWSGHDEANKHFRRYIKKELCGIIKDGGFEIARHSYWNFILFLPVFIARFVLRYILRLPLKKDDLNMPGTVINKILLFSLWVENKILRYGINFPFGVSLFVMAKKK